MRRRGPRTRVLRLLVAFWVLAGCGGAPHGDGVSRVLGGERIVGRFVSPFAYEHFMQGQLAFDRGDYSQAADEFDLALTSDPSSTYLLAWHARALDLAGRSDRAEERIREALEIDADAEFAWTVRAEIDERHGRLDLAERSLRRAVRATPNEDEPMLELGAFLERHGRQAAAEEAYRSALARRPDAGRVWQALGRVVLGQGRTVEAREALEHAASEGLLDRRGLLDLAEAERRSGNPGRAVEILGLLTELDPSDGHARSARIEAALEAGLGETAHSLVEALRLHEEERPTAERAARLLAAGYPEEAALEAGAVDQSDAFARIVRGRALRETGDRAGTIDALWDTPSRGMVPADATLLTAQMLVDARELAAARTVLVALVAQAPDDARARRALADLARRQGDDRTAERTLREGGEHTARELADLLVDLGRRREAVRVLRAAARASRDARIWADLALHEIGEGDRAAALGHIERARALGPGLFEVERAEALLAEPEEQDQRFAAADRLRPGDTMLLALWAASAARSGERERARDLTERALRLQPPPGLRAKLERELRALAER